MFGMVQLDRVCVNELVEKRTGVFSRFFWHLVLHGKESRPTMPTGGLLGATLWAQLCLCFLCFATVPQRWK